MLRERSQSSLGLRPAGELISAKRNRGFICFEENTCMLGYRESLMAILFNLKLFCTESHALSYTNAADFWETCEINKLFDLPK